MNANAPRFTNDVDNKIDRALAGLRDAQPRSGLNGRILASLEQRAVAPQPARTLLSPHFALWCATSAAILAVGSLAIRHHQTTAPARSTTNAVILSEARSKNNAVILSDPETVKRAEGESKNPDVARATTNAEPFSITNLAKTTHTVSSRPERAARSGETPVFCSGHPHTGCPAHDDGLTVATSGATLDPDAQALADLHAPSHPAPPLPLTPQEKLFLRMLQYGNATELAELDPIVRAKHDADETADFKAFFPDPPPLKQPLGDTE